MAAIEFGMRIRGGVALDRKLSRIADTLADKVVRGAASKAMTPVRRDARKAIRNRTGLLGRSILRKTKLYKNTGTVFVAIGVGKGFRTQATTVSGKSIVIDPAKYAHLVEFGVAPHVTKTPPPLSGTVQHPGFAPKPFLRPALENNKTRVVSIYVNGIVQGLLKLAQKGKIKFA